MDDDLSLPKATIQKLVKEFVPGDVRVAGEAFDVLVGCCTEFVQLLSSEANEVATKNKKCMVQPDHVMTALTELGFADFKESVTAAWEEHKEEAKAVSNRKEAMKKSHAQNDYTEAELIELQNKMFAEARARAMTSEAEAASMAASYQAHLAASEGPAPLQPADASSTLASLGAAADGAMAAGSAVMPAPATDAQSQ